MAGYDQSKDNVLWKSEEKDYSGNSKVFAQVVSYNGGEKKLTILQEGVGSFNNKHYVAPILKRVTSEELQLIIELLLQGKEKL
jgi:hypothetical protein